LSVRRAVSEYNEVDVAEFILTIEDDPRLIVFFRLMPKEMAAEVFSYLDKDVRQKIVERISDKELTGIMDELFLDDVVDIIEEMPASVVKRLIKLADPDTRSQINQLLMYPESSAGSLMTIEYIEVKKEWTVAQALAHIRKMIEDSELATLLFVTDKSHHLEGGVRLRDILAAGDDILISEIMDEDIVSVHTHDNQEEVADTFKKYDLLSLPVADKEKRLVGIITIDDVVDVIEEETTEDIYKMAAMEPIETDYLHTGVFSLAKKRVVWLMVLMISATFTGMIITEFESALAANVLLASFIPMLMDTSGNAGSQASVSIIRSLVLNQIEFKDIFRIMWKEFRVSLIVGAGVAVFNFLRVLLFYDDIMVAAVVSITMYAAIIAAKFVGCTLPLIAQKLKLDPALMASPLITTIVDAIALLVYFNVAVAMLGL